MSSHRYNLRSCRMTLVSAMPASAVSPLMTLGMSPFSSPPAHQVPLPASLSGSSQTSDEESGIQAFEAVSHSESCRHHSDGTDRPRSISSQEVLSDLDADLAAQEENTVDIDESIGYTQNFVPMHNSVYSGTSYTFSYDETSSVVEDEEDEEAVPQPHSRAVLRQSKSFDSLRHRFNAMASRELTADGTSSGSSDCGRPYDHKRERSCLSEKGESTAGLSSRPFCIPCSWAIIFGQGGVC
ncbi:uncharacterized protein BT62DRAFT_732552 [Guyanagaster necrorhizus]|uniref:Uncharacterized protein n=1 Tax=Guyanagaster necrorhizus TaxID=856835 RepID=A0A9P7VXT3_9AGAR|nr:uncharacterized protein BT62DRAFT_732552 [Guyanagaster necrorhizus MCA 3950]KAG7448892.1 hypothetical protein BT62DRAFT_732552 [Guyanagaster necrorhizus MCA 3950]